MKLNSSTAILLTLSLCLSLFSGCSDSNEEQPDSSASADPAAEEIQPIAPAPVEAVFSDLDPARFLSLSSGTSAQSSSYEGKNERIETRNDSVVSVRIDHNRQASGKVKASPPVTLSKLYSLSLDQPHYPEGTRSISVQLTNHSPSNLLYGDGYTISRANGEQWEACVGAASSSQQNTLSPGKSASFKLETSSLLPGKYRIEKVFEDGVAQVEFIIDGAKYSLSLAQKEYPAGTKQISILLINNSEEEGGYDMVYRLEKKSGSQWKDVTGQTSWPEIAAVMLPFSSRTDSITLKSPLKEGTYRLTKTIDQTSYSDTFQVVKKSAKKTVVIRPR